MTDTIYTKCKHCHLFVEKNWSEGQGIAEYVHLSRGDEQDEAIDISHEAEPSALGGTIEYWRANGPMEMRLRFVYADIENLRYTSMNAYAGWTQAIDKVLDKLDTLR